MYRVTFIPTPVRNDPYFFLRVNNHDFMCQFVTQYRGVQPCPAIRVHLSRYNTPIVATLDDAKHLVATEKQRHVENAA